MLQCILGCIHDFLGSFLEIGVEGWVHTTEQGRGHGRAAELAILDGIHPGGHPADPDQLLMNLGLIVGGSLHRSLIQPDIRNVEAIPDVARSGLPGEPELDGLATEGFLPAGGPDTLGDQVFEPKAFAASPNAGGCIEGHRLFAGLAVSAFLRFEAGDDHPLVFLEVHLLQLPDFALTQAVAGLVLEQDSVVLGGLRGACVRDDRHGGGLRVRREKGPNIHDGAKRDVPKIRRCAAIADYAVGEHGEGMRFVSEVLPVIRHTEAAAAVRMVHKHEFATVGVRLFERGKLPRFGPEDFSSWFLVLRSWLSICGGRMNEKRTNKHQQARAS